MISELVERFNEDLVVSLDHSHLLSQPALEEWLFKYIEGVGITPAYKAMLQSAKDIFGDGLNMSSSLPTRPVLVNEIYTRKVVVDLLVNTIPAFRTGKRRPDDMYKQFTNKKWSETGLGVYLDRINDEVFRWEKVKPWSSKNTMEKLEYVFEYIYYHCKYKSSVLIHVDEEYTEDDWDVMFDIFMNREMSDYDMQEELMEISWKPAELWKLLCLSKVELSPGAKQQNYSKRELVEKIIENRIQVCGHGEIDRGRLVTMRNERKVADETSRLKASTSKSAGLIKSLPSGPGMDFTSDSVVYNGKLYSRELDVIIVTDCTNDSLVTTLTGHGGLVECLTINNGKLYSASSDNTIKVWNCSDDTLLTTLEGHTGPVYALAISDNKLYSASADRTVKVWNCGTHRLTTTLKGHNGTVFCILIHDGKLYSGSLDHNIKVWRCSDNSLIKTLKGHSGEVRALTIHEGKLYSAGGRDDHSIKVWDCSDDNEITTLRGHTGTVFSLAIHDSKLYSKATDDTTKIWTLESH